MERRTEVVFLQDPGAVLKLAGGFLRNQPVLHNVILSLLHARAEQPEPGRYWVAVCGEEVAGMVFQSPLSYPAALTPMRADVAAALVDAIVTAGVKLPGVNGEAGSAAAFAGQWTERCGSAAIPYEGMRLYEFEEAKEIALAEGTLRLAIPGERGLLVQWFRDFIDETGSLSGDGAALVDQWIAAGHLWVWNHAGPKTMTVARTPVESVVRVSGVYTPGEYRGHGYATACVHRLSTRLKDAGLRCILYTDLGNPTSNRIYRRIGYRAVAEALCYRFDNGKTQCRSRSETAPSGRGSELSG